MKSLKRISKMQTQIMRVLNHMVLIGGVALIALFLTEGPASGFSGSGLGTGADPYQITNVTQLQEMADDLGAHYVLMNDIDCSMTSTWNGGAGFAPVGNSYSIRFNGSFDGQGHTITGLYINRYVDYVGLFGSASANIKDVGLEDVDIRGNTLVGGLVGHNSFWTGTVTNSYVTGSVSGNSKVGGLVGENSYIITDSYATGSVSGNRDVGGLVGYTGDTGATTITNSYATGNVSSTLSRN